MELFKASRQWSERPEDERFWTLGEMQQQCAAYKATAVEAQISQKDLRVEAIDGEVQLVGKKNIPAQLTHWSFGQLCTRVGAPASYLRELPATLAAQNLNYGLAEQDDVTAQLLIHKNGHYLLRALTSDKYDRVWNADICAKLMDLPEGWRVPPARPVREGQKGTRIATAADVMTLKKEGLSIKEGEAIAPAGLYASDHDMFVFMVNEQYGVNDGTGHHLGRGFFLWNSEVGAASFGVMTFLYDAICGNHIVWGARDVRELRVRHIGQANDKAFSSLNVELIKYANESVSDVESKIASARRCVLGMKKEDVVDKVLELIRKRSGIITQKNAELAYEVAERTPRYGAPNTVWAMVGGITEVSQKTPYTDERVMLDRAAGKLMSVEF